MHETQRKLKEIIIPEMTFYSPATIVDAVDFFKKASRDTAKPGTPPEQRGVRFELSLLSVPQQGDYATTDPFAMPTNCAPPRIAAISVRAISLYDAIQLVCDVTYMKWRIQQNGTVVIDPKYSMDAGSVTRSYSVPPVLRDCFNIYPFQPSNTNKTSELFFAQLDMPSPDFSEFTYQAAFDKLRVTGTPRNLKILETVLDQFAMHMVEVEMQIHAFRTADIERLRLSDGVSLEALMALRQNGKAKPVASATALTRSGQEAIVKAVDEVIYPTELNMGTDQTGSNVTSRSTVKALVPCNFTMRETGMTLQVVPEVSTDNSQASMTLKPEWITLDRWESYPADLAAGWTHQTRFFKQPVFGVMSLESQVVVKVNETVLIGSCSTPDGEWVQVGFLTARLKDFLPRYSGLRTEKPKPQDVQRDQEVMNKIKQIIVPEMVPPGRPFTIMDLIRQIKEAGNEYNDPELSEALRGINFVVKLPMNFWDQAPSSTNADLFAANDTVTNNVPQSFTISSHLYTLYDTLKLICDVTGMQFRIRDGIVWIFPVMCPSESLITRTYPLWLPPRERINSDASNCTTNSYNWKDFFAQMGMNWPVGASISYLSSVGCFRVTNTSENLDVFEQLYKVLGSVPRMVEVDMQINAFSSEDIERLRHSGEMSVEALMDLRRKGKARPVASATVLTKSGQEAVLKGIQEVIYPTELLTAEAPVALDSGPQALMPGNFTMRETGMILQVVPEVASDDPYPIHVTIKPQWVNLEGWKSYPAERAAGWSHTTHPFKQPIFRTTGFETQTIVQKGETVLLGSSSTPDGKWVHVGFLTVK
jgi:Flp pilus assembly secretin CpaC